MARLQTHKQHNTTQHNTTQHNTTQHKHNTTQHNTTQHNTAQHSTAQHSTHENKQQKKKQKFLKNNNNDIEHAAASVSEFEIWRARLFDNLKFSSFSFIFQKKKPKFLDA